jgi:capsular exopolysaccharide synthesis family protein
MPRYLPPSQPRPVPAAAPAGLGRPAFERDEPDPPLAPLDLRQILAMLRRRIWLVLLVTTLAGGLAAYFALTTAPIYQATGVIRLTDDRRRLTGGLVDAPDNRPLMSSDFVLSEIAVLTSRAVVGKVIDSLPVLRLWTDGFPRELITDVALTDPSVDSLGSPTITLTFGERDVAASTDGLERARAPYGTPLEVAGVRFAIASRPSARTGRLGVMNQDDAAAALAGNIKARPRENTNVIDVSYSSADPVLAQRVINALLVVFKVTSVQDAAREARLRREFVEAQLKQNDSLLAGARLALSDFRSRQKSYSARERFAAERKDLADLAGQRADLDNQRRMYASVLQRLREGNGVGTQQELGALLAAQGTAANPIVSGLYRDLEQLQTVRDSLTTGRWARAETNPDVQRIDALIATKRQDLQRTLQAIVAALDDRRNQLARLEAQNAAVLTAIPATDAEEARLTERELAYQKIADQLREELQKARLAEAAEVGQVEIVDVATRPRKPIGTGPAEKILFGILLGLVLGSGCALVAEHLNTSIRGRDDLEAVLQLPGLAVIPKFNLKNGRARFRLTSKAGNGRGKGSLPVRSTAEPAVSEVLVTVSDARSVGAEAYRTLRTKLLFSRALSSLKTIVVTSPFTQDGKSTVAANLAATFAQHGLRTLLIDCDLRKPTQHEIFQVPPAPGLTELLAGEGFVAGTGRRTSIERLSLITAGTLPPDPAEVVGSARMREVLGRLAESFDVVVLDSPPVLPVADSAILASLADGVLLVVRAGQTNRRAAQLAVQQLQDVDARILGAVLNDPNAQVPRYDEYGYESYYAYSSEK